ncbi:luciferase family protein [Haloferax namakaokahaiae]|uniref:Luciferase family protein n=1 Tax=Haloferax namakaokahaiae TaxID=1748331 RepID=A0ABD5ZET4_9EURY
MTASTERIVSVASEWPGVETAPHRFGGTEFLVADKEIGHVHHAGILDLAITRRVRDLLIETGRSEPHHVLPDSAWVTYRVRDETDVDGALQILRLAYLWRLLSLRRRNVDLDPRLDVDADLTVLGLPPEIDRLTRDTFTDAFDSRASA